MKRFFLASLLGALVASCDPGADEQGWRVEAPRVLAVRAEPAQAAAGEAVQLDALVLGPRGPSAGGLRWGRCTRRKPLTEPGPVDPGCVRGEDGATEALGEGAAAALVIPPDGCRLFGPDRPDPKPGEPAGRSVDADPTGGYYAPLRVALGPAVSVGFVRLRCDLEGATQAAVAAFGKAYRPNVNPAIDSLRADVDGAMHELPDPTTAAALPRGRPARLVARWSACPASASCGDGVCSPDEAAEQCADDCQPARGCAGAETYALFDPASQQVLLRREELRVSWYVTAGSLSDGATGPSGPDGLESSTTWTPPSSGDDAWLAAVIRDGRGGVGYRLARVRGD